MNDEVRDMIGKALDGEPPIGIDYGTVRAAGRRRLARRHLGIVGGAALAVVAVAGVAVTVGQLNASPSNQPGGGPPTTGISLVPAPGRGCVVPAGQGGFGAPPDGVASDDELAESARLTEAFGRFTVPLPPGVSMDPVKPRLCVIEASWGAAFTLRSGAGERTVFIEVRQRAGQQPNNCFGVTGRTNYCTERALPDGTAARISEWPNPQPTQPVVAIVDAWRPDDTIVRVLETGSEGPRPAPRVLGDEALLTIATAPELRVNWATSGPTTPSEPSDRRAAELTEILARATVLPAGMRAQKVPGASVDAMAFYVSQGGYKLDAVLVDAAGKGNLFINLNPPGGDATVQCRDEPSCELITLADGRKATLSQQDNGGVTTLVLGAVASDGTYVTLMSSNQVSLESPGKTRAQPALGVDELIRIASIPDLHW